ncbi:peptidylprolyl isomerase [Hyphomicrobiales bacterium]|nr:peptidylprolyl isomerase [Hyphomicrobiales bacterium]
MGKLEFFFFNDLLIDKMMINYKNTLIILMLITSLFGKEILAQETQAISVIVNDEVISRYDVNQRVRLILVTSGIPPTEENLKRIETQSVKALINERIQLQEASKLEVPESQEEIQLMLDRIARGNQTTSEGIIENITSQGVKVDTLINQIKSELLWNKIVRGRFGSYINISDDEINIVYNRTIESINKIQYDISEIFIGFEDEREEKESKELADKLVEQLKNDIAFEPVAQQFSQAPSSGQGGRIGWVSEGQLDQEIITGIENLLSSSISKPIKTVNGYYIIKVNGISEEGGKNPMKNQYNLTSVTFSKEDKDSANDFSENFVSCKRLESLLENYNEKEINVIGDRLLQELPTELHDELLKKDAGDTLSPRLSEETIDIILICDRKDDIGVQVNKNTIEDNIYSQKLGMMSRRHLRDLRRDAVIEYR